MSGYQARKTYRRVISSTALMDHSVQKQGAPVSTSRQSTDLEEEVSETMVKAYEGYFELLGSIERLHRLMLDVIKDEFEQLRNVQVNSVQALLLFNIGEDQVTPGELRSRGYYQGSNVSYNVKKLVEGGFLEQERNEKDRRSVLLRLTQKGREIHDIVAGLHLRHAKAFTEMIGDEIEKIEVMRKGMRELELYWRGQIRYIY